MTPRKHPYLLLLLGSVVLGTHPASAVAQADSAAPHAASAPSEPSPPAPGTDESLTFSAGDVVYDDRSDTVTANGHVELTREDWHLRADQVTWNRATGRVVASGNVALTGPQGETAYGDQVELSDTLRDGIVENLLVVFENGARAAANSGERMVNGDMALNHAAYSPCNVVDPNGCPQNPTWQVRAARVYFDRAKNRIRYDGARIELFGLPLIPLPYLSHPAINTPGNGFLVPTIRLDRTNGVEFALPYYLRLSDQNDLTLTPHIYSGAPPMAEAMLRGLTARGAWRIQGFGTFSQRVPVGSPGGTGRNDYRGYLDATGGFQFNPRWSLSFSARVATDRTFLRRYDISRDDRLRSTFTVARNGGSSYLTISGWAVQTLRVNDSQGQQAIALPLIDFRQRISDPLLGGQMLLQLNTMALTRSDGQDTQRLFASAQWDVRRLTPFGQEVQLTALARTDLYHTQSVDATPVPSYRGRSGFQTRAFAAGAANISWPLVGRQGSGTQRLTPRIQLVASTPVNNVDIPNEDSRAFELADSNIFSINRFPGFDRFEDTARLTYGAEWTYQQPGIFFTTQIAQSYRISSQPNLFPNGTGLTDRTSDVVGRITFSLRNFIRLTHRFRLDKDNFTVRRNEFDATIGSTGTYAILGYLRLNRDIVSLGEDLPDREEARVGGRIQIARFWSIFGSAIVDLTDRAEDPTSIADGFTAIRHRLGFAYEDECLTIGLTWRHDYQDTGDARSGNTFLLRLAFRNLGV
ncbi:MAG: LPS assembly protein LptD [Sphingopyxis sp.]